MKTIVSLTPIAVERDSRTFKQAATMTRLGYRSIVVEGVPSTGLRGELPFELISVGGRPKAASAEPPTDNAPSREAPPSKSTTPPVPPPLTLADRVAARTPTSIRRTLGPSWRALRRAWLRARYSVNRLPALPGLGGFVAYLQHYYRTSRRLAEILPDADLYYLHSQLQFPALVLRGITGRFIYDAHDLYWTLRQDGRRLSRADRAIWRVYDLVERLAARRARGCVTVGQDVARLAEERFGRSFVVVRNAHDTRLDERDVPDVKARLQLDPGTFLLAVSGNYKRGMAVEPMLRAITMLPEHVVIAFFGAQYDEFPAVADNLGVADRVHFLSPVAPTKVVPVLAGADLAPILYYPSSPNIRRALPNGFFHAVAAGVPVLYPRHLSELRELAARHNLGWEIDPESPSSIVVAVRRLLEAPELLEERRRHISDVRAELSWEREEAQLARVVATALDGRKVA